VTVPSSPTTLILFAGLTVDRGLAEQPIYREGWSLSRLGERFSVAAMTVRHYLVQVPAQRLS
jgi:hypothetical protein